MSQTLDYATCPTAPFSRRLAVLANVTLVYPLLLIALLYGEWLLGWLMLGHPPQPSINDPSDTLGSQWLHPVSGVALMGFFPAAAAALPLNALHVIHHQIRGRRLAVRLAMLPFTWVGAIAVIRWDPLSVAAWWMD